MARLSLPKAGIAPNGTKYVVKFDRDWQEWQVRAYKKSKTGAWKFSEGPTCYCGDREEAISTFHHLVGYAPGYDRANPLRSSIRHIRGGNYTVPDVINLALAVHDAKKNGILVRVGKKLYRAKVRVIKKARHR